jgi:hypothetical protein
VGNTGATGPGAGASIPTFEWVPIKPQTSQPELITTIEPTRTAWSNPAFTIPNYVAFQALGYRLEFKTTWLEEADSGRGNIFLFDGTSDFLLASSFGTETNFNWVSSSVLVTPSTGTGLTIRGSWDGVATPLRDGSGLLATGINAQGVQVWYRWIQPQNTGDSNMYQFVLGNEIAVAPGFTLGAGTLRRTAQGYKASFDYAPFTATTIPVAGTEPGSDMLICDIDAGALGFILRARYGPVFGVDSLDATLDGKTYTFKRIGTGTSKVTITSENLAETFDGERELVLTEENESVTIVGAANPDGDEWGWRIVERYIPAVEDADIDLLGIVATLGRLKLGLLALGTNPDKYDTDDALIILEDSPENPLAALE